MKYLFITMQITFGILSPIIISLLLASAYQLISAWATEKKWNARYANPRKQGILTDKDSSNE